MSVLRKGIYYVLDFGNVSYNTFMTALQKQENTSKGSKVFYDIQRLYKPIFELLFN